MAKTEHKTCASHGCPWPPNCYVRFNTNLGGYFVQDTTHATLATHCWTHAQESADNLNRGAAPQQITQTGQIALF